MVDDQHAFVDVISNTLGVLILLTLLSILLHGQLSTISKHTMPSEHRTIEIKMPRRNLILPNSSYFIAISNRIIPLPLHEIARKLLQDREMIIGDLQIGTFIFINLSVNHDTKFFPRDTNCYHLSFKPNLKSIENFYKLSDTSTLFEEIKNSYIENNIVPLFFVYPSGMNIFSKLHRNLTKDKIRMRWVPASDNNDISLYKSIEQFQDFYLKR